MVKTLQKLERHCDKTTHDLAKAITLKNEVDHTVHEMEEITKKDKSRWEFPDSGANKENKESEVEALETM